MDDLDPDDWFCLVRGEVPFAALDRGIFDLVMGMMTGTYDSRTSSPSGCPWLGRIRQVYAADQGIVIRLPQGQSLPDLWELLRFNPGRA
ncbi:hypothetical protein CRD60_03340 [Bifidobacterium aemilianum]|uniref:Uncharacterized protein n=1 Tax=Bifidobacterium aemilianum TaxID=2493120 RepID=A0A366KA24_9BIFI|nr:hypothetical protein [Bifidobacterium aemilianum]RBP98187.1 hypothetical protein CRD60_03340 [Bifidobacterium aemilianum]